MAYSPGKVISDGKFYLQYVKKQKGADEIDLWEVWFFRENGFGETFGVAICSGSRDKCAEIAVMMNGIIGTV